MILTSHVRIFQCSDNWMKQMLLNGTPLSLKLKMAQRCKDNTWNRFKQIIYTQYIQTLNLHHLAPSNPKGFRRACLLCASKPLALHQGTPTHSSPVPSANHLWFDTGDGFLKKRWVSPPNRFKFLHKKSTAVVGDAVSNASISAECWLNWSIYQYILSHSFFHG